MQRWGNPVIVFGIVLLPALAWWALSVSGSDLSRGSQVATTLVPALTIIGSGIAMRAFPSGGKGAAARLKNGVLAGRKPFLRQALGVAWTQKPADVPFTSPDPGEFSSAIESSLVHWQQLDGSGRVQGTTSGIANFYRGVQADPVTAGRLMITGAPGSGKSVLASKLVVDLLTSPREQAGSDAVEVPVWLSLTGCDVDPKTPTADLPGVFRAWLGREISDVYGLSAKLAHSLVKENRVLPVLDGLDEVDPARAVAVVEALNRGARQPVILTCRAAAYSSLAVGEPVEARRPVLMDATHITLRPLEPQAIARFLSNALTPEQKSHWANVVAAVLKTPVQPIAAVLASPLRLSFAYRAYQDADDPGPLLLLSEDTAMVALVESAITATVSKDAAAVRNGWTSPKVLHWLECLATNQRDHAPDSEYDILLPNLWRLGGRFLPLHLLSAAFVVTALAYGVATGSMLLGSLLAAAVLLFFVVLAVAAKPGSSVQRIDNPRTPGGRVRLFKGLVFGSQFGLIFGMVVGISHELAVQAESLLRDDLTSWQMVVFPFTHLGEAWSTALETGRALSDVVFGIVAGLVFGLVFGLAGEPWGTRTCSQLMNQCLAYTLLVGLSSGLVTGLMAALVGGLALGLVGGLVAGLVGALMFGNGAKWFCYLIGTTQAARRGVAPRRLASFLDWGLDVGLFRMSGYALQFRHRDLYQALLTYAETPAIRERQSEANAHETH